MKIGSSSGSRLILLSGSQAYLERKREILWVKMRPPKLTCPLSTPFAEKRGRVGRLFSSERARAIGVQMMIVEPNGKFYVEREALKFNR